MFINTDLEVARASDPFLSSNGPFRRANGPNTSPSDPKYVSNVRIHTNIVNSDSIHPKQKALTSMSAFSHISFV